MSEAQRRENLQRAIDDLREQFGDEPVRELLELFLADVHALSDALGRALADDDLDTTARRAHSIKSVAGNFGASALAEMGARIERAAKNGANRDTLRDDVGAAVAEAAAVREIASELLSSF